MSLAILAARFNEERVDPVCGVYFLVLADEIVYVGQSVDVHQRIRSHVNDMRSQRGTAKEFDRCFWLQVADEERLNYETALLRALRPVQCGRIPAVGRANEAEILAGLGLDPGLVDAALISEFNAQPYDEDAPVWRVALTVEQRIAIRTARVRDKKTYRDIAKEFGCSRSQVWEITHERWLLRGYGMSPHVRGRFEFRKDLWNVLWQMDHKRNLRARKRAAAKRDRLKQKLAAHSSVLGNTPTDVCDFAHAPILNSENCSASQRNHEACS